MLVKLRKFSKEHYSLKQKNKQQRFYLKNTYNAWKDILSGVSKRSIHWVAVIEDIFKQCSNV